jgi:CubicO group peptidase (beta-lactamase class C family)
MKNIHIKLFFFSFSLLIFAGCKNRYFLKGLSDTYLKFRLTPPIDGYRIFKNRVVNTGTPQDWAISKGYNKIAVPDSSMEYMKKNNTAAYLIIKNDSICYEKYFDGFSDTSHTNSWSMAKSIVSLLVGIAMDEGKIKSVDEKVSDFIPSYNKGLDTLLTIKDLLTMSSGILFKENYGNPFGYAAKALYGNNLLWLTHKHHCVEKPGSKFFYQSGNTVLLAEIVTKATGETMSDYASEKLWKPIGAERPAFWSIDHKKGIEKGFCCFYSNARDFARIGKLMLNSGKWNGKQIIPEKYFAEATKGQTVPYYGYQWWLERVGKHKIIAAEGFSGQYILIIPDENMVVVRLGKKDQAKDVAHYAGAALGMYGE